jgi:Domain of unknown function (DUF3601)
MPLFKRKFTAADLVPGRIYSVVAPFKDFDGAIHPIGERWHFIEKNFLPYEDGLSLFIELNGQKLQVRLQWRAETQGRIIDDFSDYVNEA